MRVLLVEDNAELSRLLEAGLSRHGFDVDTVTLLTDASIAIANIRYSAMILDRGMPDGDGLLLLKQLRQRRDPLLTLVLTARDSVSDRVLGLEAGADDYLVKPFALEELVARLRALLRRPGQMLGKSLSLANVVYDSDTRQLYIDGKPCVFSARELAMLELLLRRQGRVVTKKNAEDELFGMSEEVNSNAVEVYVSRLRKSLLDSGASVQIHTIRGLGYMIADKTANVQL